MQSRITVTAVAVIALAVAGCSSAKPKASGTTPAANGGSSASQQAGSAGPTKPSKSYKLTFVEGIKGDPFYVTMACGVQSEAKKLGASVNITGGDQWDASVQTPIVNSVTAQHPDGVLIAPNDTQAMIAPLKQLTGAGIKLVLVDTGLNDNSFAESFITSDNEAGGKLAADTLASLIGGKGSVFVMNVKPGISTTDARAKGFIEEMQAKYPNIKVLDTQYNNDDAAKAASITTSELSSHPDLAGVFATNVQGAEGTATGLKQAGKEGSVKVIGFDAGPKQVGDLESGVVQGLIAQEPYQIGVDGVDQAIAALSGQPTTKAIQTSLVALTKDNLSSNAQYEYKSSC